MTNMNMVRMLVSKRQEFLHKNSIAINALEIIGVAKATRQLTSSARRSKSKPLPQIPEGCVFFVIMVTLWLLVVKVWLLSPRMKILLKSKPNYSYFKLTTLFPKIFRSSCTLD